MDLLALTIIDSLEFLTGTDGPVDRTCCDSQLFFNIIQQFKGIHGITIHLVDKGKDRDMSHDTDLEQLSGLCLHTFGSIDNHHGRISRHQGTVGILREILVSRSIQNVDAVVVIVELQNRRGYRNTSLLLDLHPVRHCMSCSCFSFYRTSQIDGSSI